MALKDILLHLDLSSGSSARLDLALRLAREHGAHLRGLFYFASGLSIGEAEVAKAKSDFTGKAAAAGISADWLFVDWSVTGVTIAETLTIYSYYSDLLIIGQPDPSDANRTTPADLPERLGFAIGCPLLVVPFAGNFETAGERVLVAWKGGRESARAVKDAMPLLERAKHVGIVSVGTPISPDAAGVSISAQLAAHLACHNVKAGYEQLFAPDGFPIGDLILNHAFDEKIDLLVMGGHIRTSRGELLLGPVFAHLLRNMTLPLFLSF